MNKVKIICWLPYASLSGYGLRSYDLLRSIIQLKEDEWDIKIVSLSFGRSPQRELDLSDPINKKIIDWTIPREQAAQQSNNDIAIFCTVPSELKGVRIGKFQMLFTASIESTLCSSDFIEGCNNIDLTICSSNHGMKVIKSTVYDRRDPQGNVIGQLKLDKPIEVLFEAVNTAVYDRKNTQSFDLDIPEKNAFLINGMWLPGSFTNPYGHDRKHIATTIKCFLETFKNTKDKPALILKVNSGTYSHTDRDYCLSRIDEIRSTVSGDLPNIYLIHGNLTESELVGLYQHPKVKALIAIGNEGWGRSLPEYLCATSKPVITTMYGGPADYIKPEFTLTVGGSLQSVHKSTADQFLLETAQIYYPDIKQLSSSMVAVLNDYKNIEEKAKRQAHYIRSEFTQEKMTEKLDEILKKYVPEFPKVVQIKLPSLSEIKLPKIQKVD